MVLHDAKVLLGWQRKVCVLTDEFSHLKNRQCGKRLGWALCGDGGYLFVRSEGDESLGGVEDFWQ
jgi:hypothetical protein